MNLGKASRAAEILGAKYSATVTSSVSADPTLLQKIVNLRAATEHQDSVLFVHDERCSYDDGAVPPWAADWATALELRIAKAFPGLRFVLLQISDSLAVAGWRSAHTVRLRHAGDDDQAAWTLARDLGALLAIRRLAGAATSPAMRGAALTQAAGANARTEAVDLHTTVRSFDKIISLGHKCQPAFQIRRKWAHQSETYPFDWLITSQKGLIDLIADGFDGFLRPGQYEKIGEDHLHSHVRDTTFDVTILHDFPIGEIEGAVDDVRAKYQRRFERFRKVLSSKCRILFVRQDVDSRNCIDTVRDEHPEFPAFLIEAIRRKHPTCDFALLSLSTGSLSKVSESEQMIAWDVPFGLEWYGDSDSWNEVLRDIAVVEPPFVAPDLQAAQ